MYFFYNVNFRKFLNIVDTTEIVLMYTAVMNQSQSINGVFKRAKKIPEYVSGM